MTLTLNTADAVAEFLEHVAALVRKGFVTSLLISMEDGRPSRVTIVFKHSPPADDVASLKALDSK